MSNGIQALAGNDIELIEIFKPVENRQLPESYTYVTQSNNTRFWDVNNYLSGSKEVILKDMSTNYLANSEDLTMHLARIIASELIQVGKMFFDSNSKWVLVCDRNPQDEIVEFYQEVSVPPEYDYEKQVDTLLLQCREASSDVLPWMIPNAF